MSVKEIQRIVQETVRNSAYKDKVRKVLLFGSQLEGTAGDKSDVDLLLDITPGAKLGMFDLHDIEQDFSAALHKEVDITTPNGLDDFIRDDVLRKARLLYEG